MTTKYRVANKGLFSKVNYGLDGCIYGLTNDISIIYAVTFSTIASVLAILFAPNLSLKLVALMLYGTVVVYEFMNTSIETTVDRIGTNYHILSKHAKDLGACVSLINNTIVFFGTLALVVYTVFYIRKWQEKYPEKSLSDYIKETFQIQL